MQHNRLWSSSHVQALVRLHSNNECFTLEEIMSDRFYPSEAATDDLIE
ncbi:hypothetical protein WKK05_01955 [Nostoc sp. UHCC 0302]